LEGNPSAEPLELNVETVVRPYLAGSKSSLDRAGGRDFRSVEQIFARHQTSGEAGIDLEIQRPLPNVYRQNAWSNSSRYPSKIAASDLDCSTAAHAKHVDWFPSLHFR